MIMLNVNLGALFSLAVATLALLCGPAMAQDLPTPTDPRPVEVKGATYWDLASKITGRTYRIFVSTPESPAPAGGYPVVYCLDGNSSFLTANDAARAQSAFAEIKPAVVVGIGYPLDNGLEVLKVRNKDLTTPISAEILARMPPNPGLTVENTGGVDDFLKMIELELKPLIAKRLTINPADQTLLGHSLGGLTVVRALFTEPKAFRTFVASSPSLFWSEKAVLKDEAAFAHLIAKGEASPRVMIAVGALEGDPKLYRTGAYPMTQEEVDAIIANVQMVANAKDLGARLEALRGKGGYHAETVVFAGESHLSVIPAVISRGLHFALSVDGDGPPARKAN